jgi:hypothetical protein
MRTFDKLIATIPNRRGTGVLSARFGIPLSLSR